MPPAALAELWWSLTVMNLHHLQRRRNQRRNPKSVPARVEVANVMRRRMIQLVMTSMMMRMRMRRSNNR